jgi:chromosome segregation ATPase
MPHIKSIRLANVYFNNATQFYDDFIMKLEGRNTIYDLENGGGKSLLLQMLLQTVLPKSHLRREKPISLIFQGSKDRTSHSVTEWILEDGSAYKYMMTGFCARKRRGLAEPSLRDSSARESSEEEENLKSGDVEHLNWCVFYNDNRITGINSIPLVSEDVGRKTYAGFDDIRKYIQQMNQKGLPARVFDRIDEYQGFIAGHNLIPAEWNIIRGINSGENSIESYFRQNATSRKLIENQFVKIIEDVEMLNKGDRSGDESLLLADTLIELRSRLNEYIKLKSHISEFEKIKEYYDEFGKRNEELGQGYLRYEESRQRAAVIKQSIGKKLKSLKDKLTDAEERLKFNMDGRDEGAAMERLLEAGLINLEKRKLSEERQELEAERARLEEVKSESEKRLNELYTLEAYGEYRNDLQLRKKIEKRLENLQSDGDTLKTEYRTVGGKYRYHMNRLSNENEEMMKTVQQRKSTLGEENKALVEQRILEETKKSILEKEIAEMEEEENVLAEELGEVQSYFLRQGEMTAVLEPGQSLERLKAEIDKLETEINAIREKLGNLQKVSHSTELEIVRIEGEIQKNEELQIPLKTWLIEYEHKLAGFIEKADAFGKKTVSEYADELGLALHRENMGKLEKEIETARIRKKKQLSEDRGYYVPNEEILSLEELLSTKCEYVRTGIDWIADLEEDQREVVVTQMPFLSYSVIIDGVSFGRLKDNKLKINFSSDYPVPIVSLESLRPGQNWDAAHTAIYYLCSFSKLLTSEESYLHYIRSAESVIDSLEKETKAAEERVAELTTQRMEAATFLSQYSEEQVENHRKKLRELGQDATFLSQRIQGLQGEIDRLKNEEHSLNGRNNELHEIRKVSIEKLDKLTKSTGISKELEKLRSGLKMKRTELNDAIKKTRALVDTIEDNGQQQKLLEEKITGLQEQQYEIKVRLEKLAGFEPIGNGLPLSQLEAEYTALEADVSGQVAEENSLRDELTRLKDRLEKLKSRILRDYGGDLEQIGRDEAAGRSLIIPGKEMISAAKKVQKENQQNLVEVSKKVQAVELMESAEAGKLEQILRDMPEGSNDMLPQYETSLHYRRELEYYGQLIASYEESVASITDEINGIKGEIVELDRQSQDFDAFMEREKITDDIPSYDGTAEIKIEDYRIFERSYRDLQDEIGRQFAKWDERIRVVRAESADFIIREPLEELEKISRPESFAQCRIRSDAFREYFLNIDEQMQKIENDIRQLESYQHNFTQRCVQRAELILGHLKKLEALSRIEVYGRRINMIELKLIEFDGNEKQMRMKNHIEGIIREINESGTVDRKRVAALLSTKELLARIIDMDKAIVRLYKVESIPENSRYYRWENAIGSEGQNNSLYFIFAACLISFIRMLSISNTAARTKKVIIADNPFGSTSAVYLWDPMFKIMKLNDIQLIAPGHRIPREITSRFGVSYLLNQNILQDGRIRVVVKDVRAEEDEEAITWLDPEQLTMF